MTLLSSVDATGATPIDAWVAAQGDLTAVERFSQRHEGESVPRQARYYRELIPSRRPGAGEQYAFSVDLDSCTGCKACVAACHNLNGLDDGEEWRRVRRLAATRDGTAVQLHVTSACHHCVDPACLNGCPVDAYEKDPITGIVTHLDDQCIGCSYCTLACPYEVPVFDHDRGIVRKCDLCTGRLSEGEAPACVQGCPNGAITVTVVDIREVVAVATHGALAPGEPRSAITRPSTRYHSAGPIPASLGRSPHAAEPAGAHPPLTVMLVLTQFAVGVFGVDLLIRVLTGSDLGALPAIDAAVGLVVGLLALGASLVHLGRPRLAYRAALGIRHSWLSREVVAFGVFTALAAFAALLLIGGSSLVDATVLDVVGAAVVATGAAAVMCSVLVYTTTRRTSWEPATVALAFALTTAIGGAAGVAGTATAMRAWDGPGAGGLTDAQLLGLLGALVGLTLAKLVAETLGACRRGDDGRTRALHRGPLRSMVVRRRVLAVAGGVGTPLLAMLAIRAGAYAASALLVVVALAVVAVGELAERTLFFTTAGAPQ